MSKKRFSIAFLVTSMLAGTCLLLTLTILAIVKSESNEAAIESAEDFFQEITQKTEARLEAFIEPVAALTDIASSAVDSNITTSSTKSLQNNFRALRAVLDADEDTMSAYIGYDDGAFYQVIKVRGNEYILEKYDSPLTSAYIDRSICCDGNHERKEVWRFFDSGLKMLGTRVKTAEYDPRVRPWFKSASGTEKCVFTPPYVFSSSRLPGVTCARTLADGGGVFGMDISMARIGEMLSEQKLTANGKLWVVDSGNRLISCPGEGWKGVDGPDSGFIDAGKSADPVVSKVADFSGKPEKCSPSCPFFVEVDGEPFMASLTPMPLDSGLPLVIAAAAPVSDITGHISRMSLRILVGSLIIMSILTMISFYLGRRASGALKALVREARKVQQFDFSPSTPVDSNILELHELGGACEVMKSTISEKTESLVITQGRLKKLVDGGLALSGEKKMGRLVQLIFESARDLLKADGGVLYLKNGNKLGVELISLNSSSTVLGGLSENPVPRVMVIPGIADFLAPDSLLRPACEAYTSGRVITDSGVSYSLFPTGMEREHGHVTVNSLISVPIISRGDELLGVIQLFNPGVEELQNVEDNTDTGMQGLLGSLMAQAAVGLDNHYLVNSLEELLDSLIRVIASSIDAKSPYTAGHCTRVPQLAEMLAEAVHRTDEGSLADFRLDSEDERRQMWLAGWLHDCGKVITPEYVVDKGTKLETIYDRIHEVRMRFEVMRRDVEIDFYRKLQAGGDEEILRREMEEEIRRLEDDFEFIAECNTGSEYLSGHKMARIREIAERTWLRHFDSRAGVGHIELARMDGDSGGALPVEEKLLADKAEHIIPRSKSYDHLKDIHGNPIQVPENEYNRGEIYNLCTTQGTLTAEERFKINEHTLSGLEMLRQIPFPERFSRVPEIAAGHHEHLNGKGYPLKRDRSSLSVESRILAIADVFEALTASDRPYKKSKTLSQALRIMTYMCKDEQIDSEIFDIFLKEGIYRKYAQEFLSSEQIDVEDITTYLNQKD